MYFFVDELWSLNPHFFLQFGSFLKKIYVWPLGGVNSSLDPGVDVRTYGAEITRLDATDLGSEVPGRAQQDILDDVDVAGTSTPEYIDSKLDATDLGADLRAVR